MSEKPRPRRLYDQERVSVSFTLIAGPAVMCSAAITEHNRRTIMKKLILAIGLTFALATSTVTVMTVHPQPAMACSGNGC
jgi:hypothetical protein